MAETYKCLNPTGTQMPVKTSPLAPRLDTIDGKTIHMSICGEQDIWYFLEKKLKTDYPNVNWTVKKRILYYSHAIMSPRDYICVQQTWK